MSAVETEILSCLSDLRLHPNNVLENGCRKGSQLRQIILE